MLYMLALLRSTPGDCRLVKGGKEGKPPVGLQAFSTALEDTAMRSTLMFRP